MYYVKLNLQHSVTRKLYDHLFKSLSSKSRIIISLRITNEYAMEKGEEKVSYNRRDKNQTLSNRNQRSRLPLVISFTAMTTGAQPN